MYPFNRKDVENDVWNVVNSFSSLGKYTFESASEHIILMLFEINKYAFSQVQDDEFYSESKYVRDRSGAPVCSFAKYCFNENWKVITEGVSDDLNMTILKGNTLYQDYVEKIKNSSEYISMQRNSKLSIIMF
jgi:hypothetical protein